MIQKLLFGGIISMLLVGVAMMFFISGYSMAIYDKNVPETPINNDLPVCGSLSPEPGDWWHNETLQPDKTCALINMPDMRYGENTVNNFIHEWLIVGYTFGERVK